MNHPPCRICEVLEDLRVAYSMYISGVTEESPTVHTITLVHQRYSDWFMNKIIDLLHNSSITAQIGREGKKIQVVT